MLEYDGINGFNQCSGEEPLVYQALVLGSLVLGLLLLVVAIRFVKICRRKRQDSKQRSELESEVQGLTEAEAS